MLNKELVDALYNGLPKAQQQELIGLLFKRSKQTMNYFHRTKDISMSKLEILADFFHMSMDSLRLGGNSSSNYVPGNNNNVSCNFVNSDVMLEKQALEKENAALRERILDLQARIADKDALIEMQKKLLDNKND